MEKHVQDVELAEGLALIEATLLKNIAGGKVPTPCEPLPEAGHANACGG